MTKIRRKSSSKVVDKDKSGRCFQCHQLGHQVKDCQELEGGNKSSLASFQSLAHLHKEYNANSFNDDLLPPPRTNRM